MVINKLKLIVGVLSIGCLTGTAFAADPSDILPLNPPIIPLQRICKLTINDSKKIWGDGKNYTFRINYYQTPADYSGEKMIKQFTCVYSNSQLKCDGGADNSVTFDCNGMQYFWVEGKYAPATSATDCGSGPKWSCYDTNWKWKYWSVGLNKPGITFDGFVLGSTRGGGNEQMCVSTPPDSTGSCS